MRDFSKSLRVGNYNFIPTKDEFEKRLKAGTLTKKDVIHELANLRSDYDFTIKRLKDDLKPSVRKEWEAHKKWLDKEIDRLKKILDKVN